MASAPKELVRRGLDDGTARLQGQFRDTTQQDQQDGYGGDQIEDTAAAGGRQLGRTMERLLKRKKPGRPDAHTVSRQAEHTAQEQPAETRERASQAKPSKTGERPKIKTRDTISEQISGSGAERPSPTAGNHTLKVHTATAGKGTGQRQEHVEPQGRTTPATVQGRKEFVQEQGRAMAVRQAQKQQIQTAKLGKPTSMSLTDRPVYANPRHRIEHTSHSAVPSPSISPVYTGWQENAGTKASIKAARSGKKAVGRSGQRAVKTAGHTAQKAVKTAGRSAQTAQKTAAVTTRTAKQFAITSRVTVKSAAITAKTAAKAAVTATKAVIAAGKSLVAAIAAGGWVAVVIVLLICLVGLLAASPFGIFFAEDDNQTNSIAPSAAVAQINGELADHLNSLWLAGAYDSMEIQGQPPAWAEVLAVFAAKTSGAENGTSVAVLDAGRVDLLRTVFWDMTKITTEEKTVDHPAIGTTAAWTEKVLSVTITPRTPDDMRVFYSFTQQQNAALDNLLVNEAMLTSLAGDLTVRSQSAKELLAALPDDLSPERRAVVETACRLVGKVNYFWGGKSLVLGWDDRWGTLRKVWAEGSSSTGSWRPYGLDCSGFVDWVFYNISGGEYVMGHGGGASAQHTYCTAITWDEALPGDLVFYPSDTHVGIVGGKDENGELLIVHCASGYNNVVITGKEGFTSVARPDFYAEVVLNDAA